jgi:hypothetical protein
MTTLKITLANMARQDQTTRGFLELLMGLKRVRKKHRIKTLVKRIQAIYAGATDSSVRSALKNLARLKSPESPNFRILEVGAQAVKLTDIFITNLPRILMRGRKIK